MMASSGASPVPDGPQDRNGDGWESTMEMALSDGRGLMKSGLYSKALAQIMTAVNSCRCDPAGKGRRRHGKDKSCNISQCAAAVQSKDADALYRVAQDPCACGYEWPSCSQPLHVQALDALAECLEKADQLVSAFSTALGIIRLNPASAAGYCRVAKIIRNLLKNSRNSNAIIDRSLTVIVRDAGLASADLLRDMLNRFVTTGLYNTERYRQGPNDSYYFILRRMAESLRIEEARRDPCKLLPVEVLRMVFSHLDTTGLVRCLLVSKRWNQIVQQDRMLWTDLRLGRPQNPGRFFSKFLQRHQEITTFAIRETVDFALTETKLRNIVYGLPRLKRLSLCTQPSPGHRLGRFSLDRKAGASLTHLYLTSFYSSDGLQQLIQLTSPTLEVLDLVGIDCAIGRIFYTVLLPKLKKLRVAAFIDFRDAPSLSALCMEPIVRATPNLEKFYLDGFLMAARSHHWDPALLWPCLRELVLGLKLYRHDLGATDDLFPPLSSSLRSIEILSMDPDLCKAALFSPHMENTITMNPAIPDEALPEYYPSLPNLEVFRYVAHIELEHLKALLEPAAKAGKLKVLELDVVGNDVASRPAESLAFAASDNLHTLGLHNFNWGRGSAHGFDGQPLIDWLECFPNLHTVAVYPGRWVAVELFIMKLIQHPKVRTIHQDVLQGVHWDQAVKLAAKHGVSLHHSPKHMPVVWPMLED